MIVMKFGGTSVDGAARLAAAARVVVSRRTERPVVVTSAMAGVTNALEALLSLSRRADRAGVDARLEELRARHLAVAAELAPGDAALAARLEERLRDLRVLLRGVRLVGALTPAASDAVLGHGELLAQELFAAAMAAADGPAEVVDARRVVATDGRHGAAVADQTETAARAATLVAPLAEAGVVPILAGYVGGGPDGAPTTLGRGGSDLSASIIGLALGARRIEIWTDVDGILSADPRVVPAARLLERATFREAAELAGFGAKVLHPASIDPAVEGGIEVVVRNSLRPDRPGTVIGPSGQGDGGARAVASRSGLELLALRAPGAMRDATFGAEAFRRLGDEGLAPLAVAVGPLGFEFLLPEGEAAGRAARAIAAWGRVDRLPKLALVALVGEGLAAAPELWRAALDACGPIRPLRIAQGPRGASLLFVARDEDAAPLTRLLHAALLEGRP